METKINQNYLNIEQALKDSATLHASRSAAGFVIRLEKDGKLLTYGEYSKSPTIMPTSEYYFEQNLSEHLTEQGQNTGNHIAKIPQFWGNVIECFNLCGDSIDIYYSKKDHQFICNSQTSGNKGCSGVGNELASAIYSCIHSQRLYAEFARMF